MNSIQWIVRELSKRPPGSNAVVDLVRRNGSMTRQGLIRATGVSSATVDRYINAGIAAGLVERVATRHRGQARIVAK